MTQNYSEELLRLAFEEHDNCVSCGYVFVKGDTTHLGYDPENRPLYVCDSCSSQLEETVVRHVFSPRPYEAPPKNSHLWRYMDFTKYVSMLSSSGLYFSRADRFDDHFEGAKGIISRKDEWDKHYLSFFEEIIKNPPEDNECKLSKHEIKRETIRLLRELEKGGELQRKKVFISCWHENEYESEAMWKLYSSYMDNAIAIKTTYSSLYKALGKNPSIYIGRVKYIDYSKNYAGVNDSFWRKRKSFSYENEVRAIIHDHECKARGKIIECDLDTLIEELYVSPSAPTWFVSLINDVNNKYGLDVEVSPSNLNEQPFY